MKKILIIAIALMFCVPCFADDENTDRRFKLYPTKNMWTFLKLDTHTGRIWQVQYSVDGPEYRFESSLSLLNRADDRNFFDDRFALYPTENTYNFLLLDQHKGKVWQVQWGKSESRMVLEIE